MNVQINSVKFMGVAPVTAKRCKSTLQGLQRRGGRGAMAPHFFVNYAFLKLVKDFLNSLYSSNFV